MNLAAKSDEVIVQELRSFRRTEKDAITNILHRLAVVDDRKIYAGMSYSSVYEFCMDELDYSKDEAYLRVQAMRLMKSVPETEKLLDEGALSLTVAARAQIAFKNENSRRKAEGQSTLSTQEKAEILLELESTPTRRADKILATHFPQMLPQEVTKPVDAEHDFIGFTVDAETRELFEKLKGLLDHKNYEGRWDLFFKKIAKIAEKKLNPLAKATTPVESDEAAMKMMPADSAWPAKTTEPPAKTETPRKPVVAQRRWISVHTKRALYKRSRNQCEFVDPLTGRRCTSNHSLEIDHIHPFSMGGGDELENLRLLCDVHNRYEAKRMGLIREPVQLYVVEKSRSVVAGRRLEAEIFQESLVL